MDAEWIELPPDTEPGWDHVPVVRYRKGCTVADAPEGSRVLGKGDQYWGRIVTSWTGTVAVADWHIRSASHPERLRWLEEQRQAKARAEMMPWRETTYAPTSAIERAFPIADTVPPDPFAAADANLLRYKAGPDARFVHVTVDLFAAVRAEAKRMMDDGVDPRLVLGALDACILRRDAAAWNSYLAIHASRALSEVVIDSRIRALEPCYHGNRAGTCGW